MGEKLKDERSLVYYEELWRYVHVCDVYEVVK